MTNNEIIREFKYLFKNNSKPCFLIGNGINRYPNNPVERSWIGLLTNIRNTFEEHKCDALNRPYKRLDQIPDGISLTEFYEMIYLNYQIDDISINHMFSQNLNWIPAKHHKSIVDVCSQYNIPVLTTNFDHTLEKASGAKKFTTRKLDKGFSTFYPWEIYYGVEKNTDSFNKFSIWHVQGDTKYERSMKLGLRHYVNQIAYMRKYLPIKPIYEEKEKFRKTWLKIFYECQLVVFGLALEENETILRWLLIQRARYHKQYNIQMHPNYFILIDEYDNLSDGKKLFFKSLNFEFIHFKTSMEFYEDFWNHFL